jgi:glucosamine-6-phosphate deaminase
VRVIIQRTPAEAVRIAAQQVAQLVRERPAATLGLATGRTMVPFYQELVAVHRQTQLSFRRTTVFALDEYRHASPAHPASCRGFLERQVLRYIDIEPERVKLLDGRAADPLEECRQYEISIQEAGGIDLQLLGIGGNGHIGFNEPGSTIASRARVVTLSELTREVNAPQWGGHPGDVPREALTLGIGTILEARACLLLAFGASKAGAVAAAVEGPVTPVVPASALQTHPATTFVLDADAAGRLTVTESDDRRLTTD